MIATMAPCHRINSSTGNDLGWDEAAIQGMSAKVRFRQDQTLIISGFDLSDG
jgi:hypothetical protein